MPEGRVKYTIFHIFVFLDLVKLEHIGLLDRCVIERRRVHYMQINIFAL